MSDARWPGHRADAVHWCLGCATTAIARAWDVGLRLRMLHETEGVGELVFGDAWNVTKAIAEIAKGRER